MHWACIQFPHLPLRAVFDDEELAQPCSVLEGPRQRQHLTLVNAVAKRGHAREGHALAVARALCAGLLARARDRAGERRLLQSLAAWAYRYSSQVSIKEPDALLIEIGASLTLFGGWPALERRLREDLAALGHIVALAVAPVPAAARALTARHDGFFTGQREPMLSALGNMSLVHASLPEKICTLLYGVGARTLRDVFALPRPELARRIGPAALAQLDRLRGSEQEILALYQPSPHFAHRIEFDDRIEAWPPLLFPLRRLCGELALFLVARDGGVQRCAIVLEHEDKPATRVAIELLTPQREARTLYELLRSRLERAALVAPVCGMALIADDLPEFRPRHQDLFEPQRAQGLDWPALIERLRAHLGDSAVRGLALAADHRPEHAWRFDAVPNSIAELRPRPLWLLPRALPLRGAAPRILAGPERIESGWWDGGDVRRDYYLVQTRDGQRAWAFLAAGAREGWMLHGWFA